MTKLPLYFRTMACSVVLLSSLATFAGDRDGDGIPDAMDPSPNTPNAPASTDYKGKKAEFKTTYKGQKRTLEQQRDSGEITKKQYRQQKKDEKKNLKTKKKTLKRDMKSQRNQPVDDND